MHRIESLLRKEIGLDAASIGSSLIERTVRLRMKKLGLKRAQDYERLLNTSPSELGELTEAVVVTETWFFRDQPAFAAFRRVTQDWLQQHPAGTVRVLSVPCSSGEEPYSLAMALLDAQVPPHRFSIQAVDISVHALDRAKRAVYGKNSFRGKEMDFRTRHFIHTKEGYVLGPQVRECVQFFRENLLDGNFLVGHAPYDVIFCRNLLIYFDRTTQILALDKLHRLLSPQGTLFVGPAELPLVMEHGFVSANQPMTFACRRSDANEFCAPSAPRRKSCFTQVETPSAPIVAPANGRPSPSPSDPFGQVSTARRTSKIPSGLDVARQLADASRFVDAVAICEDHLRKQGASAEAYYLLGLIHDAKGDSRAVDCYRKALYLDPNHYETLVQMSLLLEKAGDANGARTFKRRAERAQQK